MAERNPTIWGPRTPPFRVVSLQPLQKSKKSENQKIKNGASEMIPCRHNSGTNHRNGKHQKNCGGDPNCRDAATSSFFREKSQKWFGPGMPDSKLSVKLCSGGPKVGYRCQRASNPPEFAQPRPLGEYAPIGVCPIPRDVLRSFWASLCIRGWRARLDAFRASWTNCACEIDS